MIETRHAWTIWSLPTTVRWRQGFEGMDGVPAEKAKEWKRSAPRSVPRTAEVYIEVIALLVCEWMTEFHTHYNLNEKLINKSAPALSQISCEWVMEYAIFLHGLAQQWRPRKKRNLAQGWGWCPNFEYTHSAQKAHDTTLGNEKWSQHNRVL